MLYEDLRSIHEDLERLEQAVSDRMLDEPKHIRDRLARDHEMSQFLERIKAQSQRGLSLYKDTDARTKEIQSISTGDQFDEFYKQLNGIKDFHKRYPNEPVENLERAYKRRAVGDVIPFPSEIDTMFTGEEAFGRFFDMMALHEEYINLPGLKRRITYLQYLDSFDNFDAIPRPEKTKDQYFQYVGALSTYLEGFMRRTKPLEDLDKLFASFDKEFEEKWGKDDVQGWSLKGEEKKETDGPATEGSGEGVWCPDCEKEFKNDNIYKAHLSGKKHIKLAEARKARIEGGGPATNGSAKSNMGQRLKERAIAQREYRTRKLAAAMQTERSDTRANVERKQGMTDKERQQELQALYAEATGVTGAAPEGEDDEDEEGKIYNPLKLPLAWDGKPIPFWLYKLHGLGVEFPCEICGNFVYMGRRAFDKHFSEARHLYGLKCLGITNSTLFREITGIEEAKKLWDKITGDKKSEQQAGDQVVQMEDQDGNVMPEKVYYDLLKQGLL
ncbi:putative splicing factor 3a subunit 3 [Delphinella strobiligena]|nr:putative splicing factor 3a subunit 3 [Delphinella strobiligena]